MSSDPQTACVLLSRQEGWPPAWSNWCWTLCALQATYCYFKTDPWWHEYIAQRYYSAYYAINLSSIKAIDICKVLLHEFMYLPWSPEVTCWATWQQSLSDDEYLLHTAPNLHINMIFCGMPRCKCVNTPDFGTGCVTNDLSYPIHGFC